MTIRKTLQWMVLTLVLPVHLARAGAQGPAAGASLLIRNGEVLDGTGSPARRVDIRVAGDSIVDMAPALQPKPDDRVIDAGGKTVAPGFIDMHSHADRGIDKTPDAESQVLQGITTAVVGQDGGGELPISNFYENIGHYHPSINFATAVGHGMVRSVVMGGDFRRPATPAEIEIMKALVDRAMKDGAIGLSSGLEYDPGHDSKTEELIALAKVVAPYRGLYSSHVRDENEGAFDAWREAIEIGRQARIPVEISHIKLAVTPVWGKAAEGLKILEDANREGLQVMADWYPYTFWHSSIYVLISTRDFENRAEWQKGLEQIGGAQNVIVTDYRPDPSYNGKNIAQIAQMRATDPVRLIIEMIHEAGPGVGIMAVSMDEKDLTTFVAHPQVLICSDGSLSGRHPRGYGAFPRVLARYVRDLNVISLPEAIAKMTGRSARQLGFVDRGSIAVGKKADLVIFDPATIQDRGTIENAAQSPAGIRYVIVNGQVVLDDGRMTNARPGRGLRRQ
jgi:N-acyl-D-amino-acid deacylase